MEKEIKIALLGQPNSGKSTVFNTLTGSHQHVGNWPGKTVEKKEGYFTRDGKKYRIADLPGSYSLSANSEEEVVTRDYIAEGEAELVCILADASQLERSMFMLADYAGIETGVMLVITMVDVAKQQGKKIQAQELEKKLGIPVAELVAPDKKSYDLFFAKLEQAVIEKKRLQADELFALYANGEQGEKYREALTLVPENGVMQYSNKWLAAKLLEQDEVVVRKVSGKGKGEQITKFVTAVSDGALYTSDCKFAWIEQMLEGIVSKTKEPSKLLTRFDKAAISRRWGKCTAIGIILLGLCASMMIAAPIMGIGGMIPALLSPFVNSLTSFGVSTSLTAFINGVIVTPISWTLSMLGFVFGINLVFGLIEEVGYMARVSYAFDGTMNRLGLQGKAIMPLLIGVGCTIGGAAGTRVVDSWGQRVLTIALVWAVPCGATFAVIPTLATAFFGPAGILVMVLLFLIMFLHIWITAKVFGKKLNPVDQRCGIIMELPPYHKPRWGALLRQTVNRVWDVFRKAFAIIVVVSAVFFLLSYSSSGEVEASILYKVGAAIEPVTRFFGMGWETFMAFLASMVSKEAVLGVLSSIFAGTGSIFDSTVGTAAADANLGSLIAGVIPKAEALAFMVAVTFNVPCVMAVSSTYQESHSLKWTLRIAAYYIATALILSFLTFHIASLFM